MRNRSLLWVWLLAACAPEDPDRAHPGCPGESFRSATSDSECVCSKGKVLRAGPLECKKCDPVPSLGKYCDCENGNAFTFEGQLGLDLGITAEQVSCEEPAECAAGQRYDAALGGCVACGANECGGTCGGCPVARLCMSGQCVSGSACVITDVELEVASTDNKCAWRSGEIKTVPSALTPGYDCSFRDEKCTYEAGVIPLGGWEPSCPRGAKRSANDPDLCVCKDAGEVLQAGTLQCEACDPVASHGAYCDCGENAMFSNDYSLELYLGLSSPRAQCGPPSPCGDRERLDEVSGACVACAANECGQGCPLCSVGSTCVSGTCVAASAARVTAVYGSRCSLGVGDFYVFGALGEYLPGEVITQVVDADGCAYDVRGEELSK